MHLEIKPGKSDGAPVGFHVVEAVVALAEVVAKGVGLIKRVAERVVVVLIVSLLPDTLAFAEDA